MYYRNTEEGTDNGCCMVLISDGNSEIGAHVRNNLLFDLFKAFD